jgi:hypothetical protein
MQRIRSIEVVIDVPESNLNYREGDPMYVAAPAGVSPAAVVGANIVAGLVIAGINKAVVAPKREAEKAVGDSVKDVDLRGTTFAHLQRLVNAAPEAPRLSLSSEGFPKQEEEPVLAHERMAPPGTYRTVTLDPMLALINRAKASRSDATLYIRVVPFYEDGGGRGAVVRGGAWLYDKSGQLLSEWQALFAGPSPAQPTHADAVRWWSDGRYRRFIAQGTRAVVLPIAEDLMQPALHAKRQADFDKAVHKVGDAVANGVRIYSTACTVETDDARVIYRYERQRLALNAGAYCTGETLKLWNQDLVPGLSWVTDPMPHATVVTKDVR